MGWGLSRSQPGPAGALAGVHTPSGAPAAAGHISPCPEGVNGAARAEMRTNFSSPVSVCAGMPGEKAQSPSR